MKKRSLYSGILIVLGLSLFLLLIVDCCYFDGSMIEGHFWSPKMTVVPQTVDFGDVVAAGDVRQEITINNTGRSALVIDRISPHCSGCIVVHSYPAEPIPPGKQGKIDFSLDITEKQGNFGTSFLIISNAKPQEVAEVQVTANVLVEKR